MKCTDINLMKYIVYCCCLIYLINLLICWNCGNNCTLNNNITLQEDNWLYYLPVVCSFPPQKQNRFKNIPHGKFCALMYKHW